MANLTDADLIAIRALPAATSINGSDVLPLGQLIDGAEEDRGGTIQQFLDLLSETGGPGGAGFGSALSKVDETTPVFSKISNTTASVKAGTKILFNGVVVSIAESAAIVMPPLVAGTDYYIFYGNSGFFCDPNPAPEGYLPSAFVLLGGFHFAPGGNATGYNTGGNSTPQINEWSFWDLKFRPSCPNPRGMTFVPLGRFWADIYPACRNPEARGSTSSYGGTIADGRDSTTWPVNPTILGGNGSITYPDAAGYNLMEFINAYGKDLATTAQFRNAAYGVVENQSRGSNWTIAELVPASTSKWGVMMATGCGFMFGREFSSDANFYENPAYNNIVGGRGKVWTYGEGMRQFMHGGGGLNGINSGSRCTHYLWSPNTTTLGIGARGYADHYQVA